MTKIALGGVMNLFKTLLSLFSPSERDKEILDAINKLNKEYDVRIGPRGGISKTSKPEFCLWLKSITWSKIRYFFWSSRVIVY